MANHEDDVSITLKDEVIIGKTFVKLLGVKIDNKLDFNEHISNIYKKGQYKIACSGQDSTLYE